MTWVIARTGRQRPTVMHKVHPTWRTHTKCGLSMGGWSRAYFDKPIEVMCCRRCR